ncbi:MAG: hypothetical protein ABIE22_00565 [archaeon]
MRIRQYIPHPWNVFFGGAIILLSVGGYCAKELNDRMDERVRYLRSDIAGTKSEIEQLKRTRAEQEAVRVADFENMKKFMIWYNGEIEDMGREANFSGTHKLTQGELEEEVGN